MGSTRRRPTMNLEYWRDYVDEIEATPVDALLGNASPAVRTALEHALLKRELTPEEGLLLYTAGGDDLRATVRCADIARAEDAGNEVTYVVNRNINFTNVCFVGCRRLRSFRRYHRAQSGRRSRARCDRDLHAGRHHPRHAAVQVSRPARYDEGCLSR